MARDGNAAYTVRIVPRSFYMSNDDWHATVTRNSDGKELWFISDWLWLLKWKTRRAGLDRAFAWSDRYEAKLARVEEFSV